MSDKYITVEEMRLKANVPDVKISASEELKTRMEYEVKRTLDIQEAKRLKAWHANNAAAKAMNEDDSSDGSYSDYESY